MLVFELVQWLRWAEAKPKVEVKPKSRVIPTKLVYWLALMLPALA